MKSSSSGIGRRIFHFLLVFLLVFVVLWILNTSVFINARVPSSSMENTVMTGERFFGNRLAYTSQDPQRFDIVVFRYPDDPKQYYVKRIIGLPGETVTIRKGKVYINHNLTPLNDSFVKEPPKGNFGPYQVPKGQYFMMGDNRNNSWDSRYWHYKFVPKTYIVAKAGWVYYPWNRFGQNIA